MRFLYIILCFLIPNYLLATQSVHPSDYLELGENGSENSLLPFVAILGIIYFISKLFSYFKNAKVALSIFDKIIVFTCFICILFLSIAFFKVSIQYFSFLRYVITIGALLCFIHELNNKKEHHLKIYYLIILIFNNPLYPLHLHYKFIWLIFDFIFGLIFLSKISAIIEKSQFEK
jgi:hypothetical protein